MNFIRQEQLAEQQQYLELVETDVEMLVVCRTHVYLGLNHM